MNWLKQYGETEGPLGFPMKDKDAKALEELLDTLPEVEFRREAVQKATTELSPGERADVSWITTETLDRQKEIVLSAGMDDAHYKGNPIVTMAHDYSRPPVGKSLWRRKVKDGKLRGVKAKTVYPIKPEDWPEPVWMPDKAFALVQSGLLQGKSIGFLTLEGSAPTEEEVRKNPKWKDAYRVIRKWLLLEYCCHWLPVNQDAVVEQVSKGFIKTDDLRALGIEVPEQETPKETPPLVVPFTTLEQAAKAVERELSKIDAKALAEQLVKDGCAKAQGRI